MTMPKLEVFDSNPPPAQASDMVVMPLGAIEEAKLAAYEQGYKAGWDDAAAAQSEDQTRIRVDLARNLQQLSFTHQEARAHILKAVEPLLEEMVNRLARNRTRDAGPHGAGACDAHGGRADRPAGGPGAEPAVRVAVETLIEQATGLPMTIEEEPTRPRQVYIRLGDRGAGGPKPRHRRHRRCRARFFSLSRERNRWMILPR